MPLAEFSVRRRRYSFRHAAVPFTLLPAAAAPPDTIFSRQHEDFYSSFNAAFIFVLRDGHISLSPASAFREFRQSQPFRVSFHFL